jgi:hypothetical protein
MLKDSNHACRRIFELLLHSCTVLPPSGLVNYANRSLALGC